MKWYEKILVGLLVILLSPIFLFVLVFVIISYPFMAISSRRSYKRSEYYKSFRLPYSKRKVNSVCYKFYNMSVLEKWPIRYVKQENSLYDYFIYENIAYIFPDFNVLVYDEERNVWDVVYKLYGQETRCSLEEYMIKRKGLMEYDSEVRLLLSREVLGDDKIDISLLSNCICVIRSYSRFSGDEDINSLSVIPSSSKELYEMMLKNDKLCGEYKFINDHIEWCIGDVLYHIDLDGYEGTFIVMKNNRFKSDITHWHPDCYSIYDDICNIGEEGNGIVIRSFLGISTICYMGNMKYYHKKRKFLFSKVYYFEAK